MAYILVVDDDQEVLGTLSRALAREGHEIALADSTTMARTRIIDRQPDLIILDVMMPRQDGIVFCRELRRSSQFYSLPILFLSAKGRTDDIVQGLNAGGDDYIAKPFELKELSARIAALLRRLTPRDEVAILEVGGLILNSKTLQVSTPHAASIQLTSTEFKLLYHLMTAPNQVHSVRDLLDGVWKYPDGSGDPDLVRAHIRNLRAKIERDPRSPEFVKTIHGIGYLIEDPSTA
jgi:DNA-binding response OmpR family regulator